MANNDKHNIHSGPEYTEIWQLWQTAKDYDSGCGIDQEIQKNIDFYEGRHWGIVSEKSKTKHLPRPVINLCELVANTKIAALDAGKTKLQYSSYVNPESAIPLTNFVNYLLNEMKFEDIKRENIFDFIVEGSSCFYAYWDNEALKSVTGHSGGIVVENIKTSNIAFANPKLTDIQKQEWIIICQSMTVTKAKALCTDDLQKNAIVADDEGNENIPGILPVLTKFWKQKDKDTGIDEVWFQRASKMTLIGKPQRICNPVHAEDKIEKSKRIDQAILDDSIDSSSILNNDSFIRKANLYPLSFNSYLKRSRNSKGRGIITDMINNQRAINFNLAMMLVSVQNNAWGQRIAKEGALKGQVLTNDPSQVLIDHHPTGQGYYTLTVQPFSQSALLLNQSIIDLVRIVTGTTEVMTGEQKSGMSGVAIATLQERAQRNIDSLVKEYRHGLANLGQVIEMLVAIFYDEREKKTYFMDKEDGQGYEAREFIGTNNARIDYSSTVVATNGSQYSEAVELQLLQDLFIGKAIDFETYLKSIPDQLFPNKEKILEDLQKSLQVQLIQKDMQLQQMEEQMKKMSEIVNRALPLLNENASLKGTILKVYNEAAQKIESANQRIQQTDAAAKQMASAIVDSKRKKTIKSTTTGNEAEPTNMV